MSDNLKKQASLANKIKLIRETSHLSQEYVASRLNISQQAYSKLEKQPEGITIKRLKDLCEVLGVPLNTLIGEEDLYIQQNYNQQGGNAGSIIHIQGIAETERTVFINHISDLKQQINLLNNLVLALSDKR
jgi:transcriptional regulator with XRE-family HTH domain